MTKEVVPVLSRIASHLGAFQRVALLSPSDEVRAMFPKAAVIGRGDWSLHTPRPDLRFDLIIADHIGHHAPDPATWLGNVLQSCRALLLADEISNERLHEDQGGRQTLSRRHQFPGATSDFDLGSFGDRMLCYRTFYGASKQNGNACGVLALIRGALTYPLIRIDDYPSGVRPILSDMGPLHEILEQFEAQRIPFHLGIVPGILNDDMINTLRTFKWMIPAQHGSDHRYLRYSTLLIQKSDPYNERGTVGGFNEFSWQTVGTIERKLGQGKALLEERLGLPVTEYIPPCNRCNRATARALQRLGFKLCLSEKPVPGGFVPRLRSDFYGRSAELENRSIPEVVTLHLTWEWDLQRNGDTTALPRLLDRVVEQTRAKEAAIASLALECRQLT